MNDNKQIIELLKEIAITIKEMREQVTITNCLLVTQIKHHQGRVLTHNDFEEIITKLENKANDYIQEFIDKINEIEEENNE